ncbi:hypothetical protein HPP92_001032 [Vanilla planifolia]|uniref:Uncharacterized protein n=1 Tax=Vanilla planifolia TaxID=51239 RepID=A0A835RQB5_VANPL|nr:hypothetical protein HPP92_001032 [Vanilla planifolia]
MEKKKLFAKLITNKAKTWAELLREEIKIKAASIKVDQSTIGALGHPSLYDSY